MMYDEACCNNVHLCVQYINVTVPFMHEYGTHDVASSDCCHDKCLPVSVCKQAVLCFASLRFIFPDSVVKPRALSLPLLCLRWYISFVVLYICMKVNKYMRRRIQFLAQIQTSFSHDQRNEGSLTRITERLACRSATPLT
jgi:hypothetical protein